MNLFGPLPFLHSNSSSPPYGANGNGLPPPTARREEHLNKGFQSTYRFISSSDQTKAQCHRPLAQAKTSPPRQRTQHPNCRHRTWYAFLYLVLENADVGAFVAILYGGRIPFGEAYVNGAMKGETFEMEDSKIQRSTLI